jgi:hypothetical protein
MKETDGEMDLVTEQRLQSQRRRDPRDPASYYRNFDLSATTHGFLDINSGTNADVPKQLAMHSLFAPVSLSG